MHMRERLPYSRPAGFSSDQQTAAGPCKIRMALRYGTGAVSRMKPRRALGVATPFLWSFLLDESSLEVLSFMSLAYPSSSSHFCVNMEDDNSISIGQIRSPELINAFTRGVKNIIT